MAPLSSKQCRQLRALGHHLDATIHVGQSGIHDPLLKALDIELRAHELVKVRVGNGCALEERQVAEELAQQTGAGIAQVLGHTILLYRERPEEPRE